MSVAEYVSIDIGSCGEVTLTAGQGIMAASIPVVVASDQTALPVSQSGAWTVTANQGTSPWVTNISQIAGTATVTAAAGVLKVGIVGNGSATLDSTIGAATAPTNAVATSAVYQSTAPVLTTGQAVAVQCDTTGSRYINGEGRKATYRTVITFFSPAASPTDIVTIAGSATKTIRVLYLKVEEFASSSGTGTFDVRIIKRSAANTGGTSVAATLVPLDSNDPAATATVLSYSANPTALGASVGNVGAFKMSAQSSASAPNNPYEYFTPRQSGLGAHTTVLHGTAQLLAVNLNGVSLPNGVQIQVIIEWTEE